LKLLAQQNQIDFDVIILGKKPEKIPEQLNILHFEENYMLGSSGGFGIGQILAYTLGYDYVINADVDCFPGSNDTVEKLVNVCKSSNKVVFSLSVDKINGENIIEQGYNINRYGIVPRWIFEKIGFQYVLFFRGGEDNEFINRLKIMGLLKEEKSIKSVHPLIANNIIDQINEKTPKYFFYERNRFAQYMFLLYYSITKFKIKRVIRYTYLLFLYFIYYFPFTFVKCKGMLKAVFDGWTMKIDEKYDKSILCSIPEIKKIEKTTQFTEFTETVVDVSTEKSDKNHINFKPVNWLNIYRTPLYALEIIHKLIIIYTNKSNYITPTNKFYENYSMFYAYILLLKPLNNRGKIYSWQTHPIKILLSVCLAILLLPVMLILLFVSILKIFISGIYPPTLGNLNKNLKEFYKFVSK